MLSKALLFNIYLFIYISRSIAGEEPAEPSDIKLVKKTLTSLSFTWTIPSESSKVEYFSAILRNYPSGIKSKNVYSQNVEFIDLEMCTNYCLQIISVSNNLKSKPSEELCTYTFSPVPKAVNLNDIGVTPSLSRIISWEYPEGKDCSFYYRVEYSSKFESFNDFKETKQSYVILTDLQENMIFKVRVQTVTKMKVEDGFQHSPYSEMKYFYTGSENPMIADYKEYIDKSETQINLSWSFDESYKGSVFEYIVRQMTPGSCVRSINLVCSSCPNMYNLNNLKNEDKNKTLSLVNCQSKERTFFDYSGYVCHATLKDIQKLSNFSIEIYAVNLMGVHKVFKKSIFHDVKDQVLHNLDIENVFNEFNMNNITKYSVSSSDNQIEIIKYDDDIGKINILCTMGELIKLNVELEHNKKVIKLPLNISCGMKEPKNILRNLTTKLEAKSFNLYWNVTKNGIIKYIISWMNNENYSYQFMDIEHATYFWKNIKSYNWQQVCIATIDEKWRTSKYSCSQYSIFPGPVDNVKTHSIGNEVYVSWDKSKDDIHHGYVVYVTFSNERCQEIIINMENYCIKVNSTCRVSKTLRWKSLKILQVRNLIPDTKLQISISSIKANYTSAPTTISVKTKSEEYVKDVKVFGNSSHIFINFVAPSSSKYVNISYKTKVTLHGINMCTFRYRVIFDDVINVTYTVIPLQYSRNCFQYEIEVVPIPKCSNFQQFPVKELSEIDYIVVTKKGLLFNQSNNYVSTTNNLNVTLLSTKLLKVYWSNTISENECNKFGFMVDIVNDNEENDCKTWIITRTTCTKMIDELNQESNCTNKEYLKYQDEVIKTSLLLHGDFRISNTYRVKVWKIVNQIQLILSEYVTYENIGECESNCQRYNGSKYKLIDENKCLLKKSNWQKDNYKNYKSNICHIDNEKNIVSYCFYKEFGHRLNCADMDCRMTNDDGNCSKDIEILSTKKSIKVKLPKILTEKSVKGYILLLHNSSHHCVGYVMKGCHQCIQIFNLKILDQKLFSTCYHLNFIRVWDHETNFNDLEMHSEYFLYIIPLLGHSTFGSLYNSTVSTKLDDPIIPNFIETTLRTNTSLMFVWKSYKNGKKKEIVNHYMTTLLNMRTNEELVKTTLKEMILFTKLDICTKFCFYLTVVYKNNLLELVDSVCTHTLSSSIGLLTLNNIDSGPSLFRDISWTYTGSHYCPRYFSMEVYNKYRNKINTIKSNETNVQIKNDILESNMIYRVKVRIETYTLEDNNINHSEYSEIKVFYTGEVNKEISDLSVKINHKRTQIIVFWMLEDQSLSSMFEFIVRIKKLTNECIASLVFISKKPKNDIKNFYLNKSILTTWEEYAKCELRKQFQYAEDYKIFRGNLKFLKALDKVVVTIYGLSVLGITELSENII